MKEDFEDVDWDKVLGMSEQAKGGDYDSDWDENVESNANVKKKKPKTKKRK